MHFCHNGKVRALAVHVRRRLQCLLQHFNTKRYLRMSFWLLSGNRHIRTFLGVSSLLLGYRSHRKPGCSSMSHTQCQCGWHVFNVSSEDVVITCPVCNSAIHCTAVSTKNRKRNHQPYGLGDYIALLTRYTGIAWLVTRITRGQCGCPGRQEKMNRWGAAFVRWLRRRR